MASLLKDLYSVDFYNRLSACLTEVIPSFDKSKFIKQIFTEDFEAKELKERMRHTVVVLHRFMPDNYDASVDLIFKMIGVFRKRGTAEDGLAFMFLPDYIEVYGLDDYDTSVKALEFITQFVSCEFAVRPFLIKYGDRMVAQMERWSLHENYKVRRFSSEGSRPRLPWAMAVPAIKKDPTKILAILENLKEDRSEWVRRSVANSLNDIAKSHPEIVLGIALQWSGLSKETDAIVKHGSRTLLKQGHSQILQHYGLDSSGIELSDFKLLTPQVKIGADLEFSFAVHNTNATASKIRLEYAVFYRMKNGQSSKKVFKISEKTYQPEEKAVINRKQKFVLITTRTFYPGEHRLSIIINGAEKHITNFELLE